MGSIPHFFIGFFEVDLKIPVATSNQTKNYENPFKFP